MPPCCPPGRGCNSPNRDERCTLTLCQTAATQEAAAANALERWRAWQKACRGRTKGSERRFLRRSFQRSRDRALIVLAMRRK
jgi:hypothetical protein